MQTVGKPHGHGDSAQPFLTPRCGDPDRTEALPPLG